MKGKFIVIDEGMNVFVCKEFYIDQADLITQVGNDNIAEVYEQVAYLFRDKEQKKPKTYEYICGDLKVDIPFTDYQLLASDLERIADIFKDMYLGIYGATEEELKEALENEDFDVRFEREEGEENE